MDLIQKAKNLGCIIKNNEYYLWEIQKWLREEHNCIIEVTFYGENIIALDDIKYAVEIDYYGKNFNFISDSSDYYSNGYNTYEEALEVGLFNALKLIK